MEICKKLSRIISIFFERKDLSLAKTEELRKIFFENLSEIFQIAFDVSLDVKKLKTFSAEKSMTPDFLRIGQFLAETLQNETTYIILNYYMYLFTQSYLNTVRKENLPKVNEMMLKQGLSESEVEKVKKDYWSFIEKRNTPVQI